jgi:hypothetical protein
MFDWCVKLVNKGGIPILLPSLYAKQLKYNKEKCSFFSAAEGTCSGP